MGYEWKLMNFCGQEVVTTFMPEMTKSNLRETVSHITAFSMFLYH